MDVCSRRGDVLLVTSRIVKASNKGVLVVNLVDMHFYKEFIF